MSLPLGQNTLETLITEIDEEVSKIQKELISKKTIKNYKISLNPNLSILTLPLRVPLNSLAEYYVFYDGDTNLINKELDLYKSISREEIRKVAQKYLNTNQRLELHYLPEPQKEEK